MKLKYTITTEGVLTMEVLDREGESCSTSLQMAQHLGTVVSDEKTGPDESTVFEGETF